jgi:hypothetical protein
VGEAQVSAQSSVLILQIGDEQIYVSGKTPGEDGNFITGQKQ